MVLFSEVFLAPSYSPDSMPQSYPKLCSRKSAVVTLSSLIPSPMDQKIFSILPVPQLTPVFLSLTARDIHLEHTSWAKPGK